MSTLDELVVRIKADASQLQSELKKVGDTTKQSTSQMGAAFASLKSQILELLPALSAVAVVEYGKRAVEAAGRIQDMADRIGFAASTISALESPLATSGSSIDEFAGSIVRMNNAIGTAAKGDPAAIKSFDELGLSVTKLAKLSPEDQFNAIAGAILKLGDQAKITEAGMNIFGRSFATMLPSLREANGNLQNLKKALSDDTVANLDDLGDAMTRVGLRIRDGFLDAVSASIDTVERLYGVARDLSAKELTIEIDAKKKALAALPANEPVFDNLPPGVPAPETPQALLRDQIAALQGQLDVQNYQEKAAEARKKTGDPRGNNNDLKTASGGGTKPQEAQDYDTIGDSLEAYLDKLRTEHDLLGMNERDRAGQQAVLEAQNIAMKQGTLLTGDQIAQVRELALSNYDLKDSMKEVGDAGVISARLIKDSFGDALESAMFDFKNFGAGASSVLEGIAKDIARKNIIDPLSSGASNLFSKAFGSGGGGILSGLGSMLGFADGGSPPVGVPSIVGERGPEIFIPKTAGTIIPNNALGGSSPTVNITNNFQSGVTRQELATLMPVMVSQSKQAVFEAIERGGSESRSVNRRS